MKKGDHKGVGGNSHRTQRKRNRYATSLDNRDRALSRRISTAEAAKKAGHPNGDDIPALWRKIRKIERLRKGCKGTNASLLN